MTCGRSPVRDTLRHADGHGSNANFPWDRFNPEWYVTHNYLRLRDDDLEILQRVRDYFDRAVDPDRPVACGIDVGSGANLYPALAMLPYCQRILLRERGAQNVGWLRQEVEWYSNLWDPYWAALAEVAAYRRIEKPRERVAEAVQVRSGDILRIGADRCDLGTMFFVAESLSDEAKEFELAVWTFVRSLRPGAPFAAAFMRDSSGYYVDGIRFPGVSVTEDTVSALLAPLSSDLHTYRVVSPTPLREGYDGMVLAVGRTATGRKYRRTVAYR
jgi:hypothetical protein